MISDKTQKILLDIARKSIRLAITGEQSTADIADAPELNEHLGAFVTIMHNGSLRGCIGCFTADEPLYKVVAQMAKAAATDDPRFVGNRIKPSELDDLTIEISVLSPMERVTDPLNEIELGKHGIYIRRGGRGGTFLPQVATEHNMTLESFLSSCCAHKAGLPADAWKDPETEVYRYSAQVFGEE